MDWRALNARLRGSTARAAVESEMQEEMRFHLEKAIERYVRQGVSADEARRRALIDFGAREALKEDAREASRARPIENIASDLHFAFRSLRKSPAFAIAAVLTVTLGIGANTAVFSVVHRVLHPLPLPSSCCAAWGRRPDTGPRVVRRGSTQHSRSAPTSNPSDRPPGAFPTGSVACHRHVMARQRRRVEGGCTPVCGRHSQVARSGCRPSSTQVPTRFARR